MRLRARLARDARSRASAAQQARRLKTKLGSRGSARAERTGDAPRSSFGCGARLVFIDTAPQAADSTLAAAPVRNPLVAEAREAIRRYGMHQVLGHRNGPPVRSAALERRDPDLLGREVHIARTHREGLCAALFLPYCSPGSGAAAFAGGQGGHRGRLTIVPTGKASRPVVALSQIGYWLKSVTMIPAMAICAPMSAAA